MPTFQSSRDISGAVTPTTNDDGGVLTVTANATVTLTSSGWTVGRSAVGFEVAAGTLTFVGGAGVTVRNTAGDLVTSGQYTSCLARYSGTNTWTIFGTETFPGVGGAAAARELMQAAGPVFRPSAYGADPTGVAESSAEIQLCIDACQEGRGVLDLRGTWLIDTGLVVNNALEPIEIVGGPLSRGATPHSAGWACTIIADTGFTGTALTITDVRGLKMRGVGIDMNDADATAIAMLVDGTYWHHFEDVHVDGSKAIGISVRGGNAGNYWGVWERCYVNADSTVGATSRAGTGFFIDRNAGDTTWVNQQKFVQCSANFLNVGWDIVEPGAGMLWENCQAEAGNTSTGVAVRATEPFEITYLDMIWRGGEINNYATGFDGRIFSEHCLNICTTARVNGATEEYRDSRALHGQSRRVTTYAADGYVEAAQISSGTYGDPVGGTQLARVTVASGATEDILRFTLDESGRVRSGFVSLTVQCASSVWQNVRDLYHLSTYWNGSGSGTLGLINRHQEVAIPGLAVTLAHDGTNWVLRVTQTSGENAIVAAHFSGLLPY